ncbi:hypothetical protein CDL15_Pgr016936 [Punica granatum]|uniref:DUF7032 domain-containing protein n=1 Tax=Punica granatum TaxID=22663 RepID=A0A218WY88_PUNGR|nr:hypothetical protein CDL15_Pgr016936 [Punica granatum]
MRREIIFLQDSRKPIEPKPTLTQSIESLSSLISLTHSIRVFAVKWQLIRNKLEELKSGLVSAEDLDENPAVSGLIRAVMATVAESFDLARSCVDLSYSGKLLMQSDLDIVLGKFDLHLKSLNEIYCSGMLTPGHALIVSKPGIGACKDDLRFYVKDLLTRMKIGDIDMKRQALVSLLAVVREEDKYVKIVVEIGEVLGVLVGFLDTPEPGIQELSAKVISVVAGFDLYKGTLVCSGVIAPLVRVLECGSAAGKEWAARCLNKLTQNADNAWSVSAHGGVTALLMICSGECSTAEMIGPSCGVLRNLVGVEEIKRFMVEEGVVSIFVKLVRSKDDMVQMNAMEFLQAIASGDEITRQMVIKEGGICALLKILDPLSAQSNKSREVALRAIENLFFSSASCINMLVNFGFLELLVHYLRKGEASVQEIALKVASRLCSTSAEAKKLLGVAGFMAEFVKFLDAKSFEVREMAAEALSSMVMVPKNRKRFVQEDQNIGFLLRLLDPEDGNPAYKKFLLSTLTAITSCNSGRRKIVNSGYLKNIEKLADAEVSDAKKLVRKLSTNRFKSMLSGMWHS